MEREFFAIDVESIERIGAVGCGFHRLKEVRVFVSEPFFERGKPVEDVDALVWLEEYFLAIERCSELVEQFIVLRSKITLIAVVADNESFKRYFGKSTGSASRRLTFDIRTGPVGVEPSQ